MKVLVTGGAGFIGSHVVDTLIEAGHEVCIVDNLWEHGGGKLENINPKARFYQMDIRDTALQQVFESERPEAICHLAAQHSVKISTDDPAHDASVNILGLINILQNASRFGTQKIIFSSSGASYGTVEKMPVDETTVQRPESPYGITKMSSELYLRFWKNLHGLDFTILRYGNVYGPRQDPLGEAGVIAIFARQILLGESIRIDWDGEHLMVASTQFANLAIDEAYASPDDAEEEAVSRFNAAIDAWLMATVGDTAHICGTCRMGASRRDAVTNEDGETYDLPGLSVADASLFPSASGVNPMVTIEALAHLTARRLAARLA